VSAQSVKDVKDYIIRQFTGDRRGDPLVLGGPTDVQLLQYNMEGFNVGPIRDVSEERVCAAMGIPAAVVGFGTGLQQTKVGATMKEMRQLAWTTGVIPMQRIVANELRRSLLPEFIPEASGRRIASSSTSRQFRCSGRHRPSEATGSGRITTPESSSAARRASRDAPKSVINVTLPEIHIAPPALNLNVAIDAKTGGSKTVETPDGRKFTITEDPPK
jgi:hypothetical protein